MYQPPMREEELWCTEVGKIRIQPLSEHAATNMQILVRT